MRTGRRLRRTDFDLPAPELAKALLGRFLIREIDGARLVGRIVETEAYTRDDPASHSYRGKTERNRVMFDRPGSLYVYFTYGMHHCMNVVSGPRNGGSAVLIRAVEPLAGLETMQESRGTVEARLLCAGPARLCQAFGIGRDDNGRDLVSDDTVRITDGEPIAREQIVATPRIGVSRGKNRGWRWMVKDDPWVSRKR